MPTSAGSTADFLFEIGLALASVLGLAGKEDEDVCEGDGGGDAGGDSVDAAALFILKPSAIFLA